LGSRLPLGYPARARRPRIPHLCCVPPPDYRTQGRARALNWRLPRHRLCSRRWWPA